MERGGGACLGIRGGRLISFEIMCVSRVRNWCSTVSSIWRAMTSKPMSRDASICPSCNVSICEVFGCCLRAERKMVAKHRRPLCLWVRPYLPVSTLLLCDWYSIEASRSN
ncbi:unnamed protein product, partial [Hapterophycus canaliculatus]